MASRKIYCVSRRKGEEPRIAFGNQEDALTIAFAMSVLNDNECADDCVTELDFIGQLEDIDLFLKPIKGMQ